MHLGSLFTALASYLDARAHQGRWLLRIDDLDTPRNQRGAAEQILACLDAFGLHWDGEIYYQSRHLPDYETCLAELNRQQLTYRCACSRKTLSALAVTADLTGVQADIYPGICRNKSVPEQIPHALRIKTDNAIIRLQDDLQGEVSRNLAKQDGDIILKRKDGIIAYQLAVVVDDYLQRVNNVVRGFDLLLETPKQIYLQSLLRLPPLHYAHVPVLVDAHGDKLSKQTLAKAVDTKVPNKTLFYLLTLLKQKPPATLAGAPVNELLDWGIQHWHVADLTGYQTIGIDNRMSN